VWRVRVGARVPLLHRADQGPGQSEKFFDLCPTFGADNVGMLTGDASVNPDAPIICCTAEILANLALREGPTPTSAQVVMDEFHYYADPTAGWAWQVPLLELPHAQFVLMSATLGDVTRFTDDASPKRTGRPSPWSARPPAPSPRAPLPLTTPLTETLERPVDPPGPGLRRALHPGAASSTPSR
jgi:hypothetical protein